MCATKVARGKGDQILPGTKICMPFLLGINSGMMSLIEDSKQPTVWKVQHIITASSMPETPVIS